MISHNEWSMLHSTQVRTTDHGSVLVKVNDPSIKHDFNGKQCLGFDAEYYKDELYYWSLTDGETVHIVVLDPGKPYEPDGPLFDPGKKKLGWGIDNDIVKLKQVYGAHPPNLSDLQIWQNGMALVEFQNRWGHHEPVPKNVFNLERLIADIKDVVWIYHSLSIMRNCYMSGDVQGRTTPVRELFFEKNEVMLLYELAQKMKKPLHAAFVVEGTFICTVNIEGEESFTASGNSKSLAKQAACARACKHYKLGPYKLFLDLIEEGKEVELGPLLSRFSPGKLTLSKGKYFYITNKATYFIGLEGLDLKEIYLGL